jgi:predicted nucleic acid-binding protein
MKLVDTSCWIHALRRKGDGDIRTRVQSLLAIGQAAWCDAVRLELWNGAANDWDRQLLVNLQATVPILPIKEEVWQLACTFAHRARTNGLNVPATDLLIFACARHHGVELEHNDRHFPLLGQMK